MSDTERTSPQPEQQQEGEEAPRSPDPPREPSPGPRGVSPGDEPPLLGEDPDLQARLEAAVRLLGEEMDRLGAGHMKEYGRMPEFERLVRETSGLCREWEEHVGGLHRAVRGLREKVGDVRKTVDKKLTSEGLLSWLEGKPAPESDKEAVASEKSYLAEAAEARAAASRAGADVARAEEMVAALEAEVAECAAEAGKAAEEAEEARKRAAEAKRAAEEKEKFEEEQRRKAAEEQKKKEAEEKKKREEEEKARQRELREAGSPEEQERRRQEAERLDPKNWNMNVYSVDPGDIDIPIGVVVRAMPGVMQRDDVTVERLEQLGGAIKLGDNEELVSQIIEITSSDPERTWTMEAPLSVCIPHCAPRNVPSREPVIKVKNEDGVWEEMATKEVTIEDIKEYKFVEVRLQQPVATLAVVTRTKRETCIVAKRGAKVSSSVDARVCFTFKQTTVKSSTNMTLEVQPIELSAVSDLKARQAPDCACLLASSPIIYYSIGAKRLLKPVMVNVPVPPNPNKSRRPNTAAETAREGKSGGKARPKSAMPQYNTEDDAPEDELHVITKDAQGHWVHRPDFNISQAKNKDVVNFDVTKETEARMVIFRTLPNTSGSQVERILRLLESSLTQRPVQILLRQQNEAASEVVVQCINIAKSERFQKKLSEEGWDLGPGPSPEIIMKEGQEVTVRFRGNIADASEKTRKFVFNSHIKTRLEFTVSELDKFAQKSIDCYRGFAQMYTRGLVPKPLSKDEDKSRKGKPEMIEGDVLLCELLISLPKPEPEAPKPIIDRAPVKLKTEGMVDNDILRHLAGEIGEEWRRISVYLNIRRSRIQAIMRNNVNGEQEQVIYEMLTTWAKRVPRSTNKVDILCNALLSAGRSDLVEDLRDKEKDFKRERSYSARDSVMKKAFIKVAQNAHIITDWKFLARQLRLPEDELNDIENLYSGMRDKCFHSLIRWRDISGDDATLDKLVRTLRRCRYGRVAEQIEHM